MIIWNIMGLGQSYKRLEYNGVSIYYDSIENAFDGYILRNRRGIMVAIMNKKLNKIKKWRIK